MTEERVRHILSLSGGKDSTALAVYMKDKIPNVEYVFCDTGSELPETYEYLDRIESYLGRKIVRLNSGKTFDWWLELHFDYLPSPRQRWCTRNMKILPFEEFVGEDQVYSYIGIRADEDREGYITNKKKVVPVYPFKEDGITEKDVWNILNKSGIGLPKYYEWRSRSGCYFCFFQRSIEWVGLLEKHPELFYKAKAYEKFEEDTGKVFTWVDGRSLSDIERDKEKIKERAAFARNRNSKANTLFEMYSGFNKNKDFEDPGDSCMICHL